MTGLVLLLSAAWVALTGDRSPGNAAFAVMLALAAVRLARPLGRGGFRRVRLARLPGFVRFFLWEVLLANARVARAVVGRIDRLRPAVVAIPLDARGDAEVELLANVLTLTPGTLSLEVSSDERTLYVHALSAPDPKALRREIKDGFERRIIEVFR